MPTPMPMPAVGPNDRNAMQEYNAGMTDEGRTGEESARPPFVRYEDLGARICFSLAAPAITEEEVYEGCQAAIARGAAEVLVRPSDVDLCKNWLAGSAVAMSALTGFPGGSSTTAARLYEARDVVRRGVTQVAVAMNLGKLVSRKFLYLESELMQLAEQCHQASAQVRAVFETGHLQQDHVLIGVRLIKRTGIDAVDLHFPVGAPQPGPELDRMAGIVRYVFHHARGKFAVRVIAPSLSWESAQILSAAGADAFAITNAAAVLDAWSEELQRREQEARKQAAAALESPATAPSEAPPSE